MRQTTPDMVNEFVEMMNSVASDKSLSNIERKVKIACNLSGEYKTICGHPVRVYRSPRNRTLLAMEGAIFGANIIKVDLIPTQVLTYLMSF